MLVLGGVAALDVAEGRVRVDDAEVTQVLQRHQVLALAQAVQPAAAERQRAKVLVDHIQQVFSPWKSAARSQRLSASKYTQYSFKRGKSTGADLIGTCPTLKFFM